MARYKSYEPKQHMMLSVDPDVMFPAGCFERFLIDIIEELDLSQLEIEKPDKGGESSYDPRSLLGIIFYGYAKGIFSSRRLSSACRSDLGFMFVSGYSEPKHSTICRFIQHHGESLKGLFSQILYIADSSGFIDYKMIAMDGTKIKGNASKQFCGTLADFEKRRLQLEKNIARAMEKQESADGAEAQEYSKNKVERYGKSHKKITTFLENAKVLKNKDGSERQQSMTDGDCRILKSNSSYICGYNAQAGVDVNSGIILTADVVDSSNDRHAFPLVAEELNSSVPEGARSKVKQSKYLADNGYYSGETMAYAADNELDVYIANGKSSQLYGDPEKESNRSKRISVREYSLSREENGEVYLTCPGGIRTNNRTLKLNHRGRDIYRYRIGANQRECRECHRYEGCMGKTKSGSKDFEVNRKIIDHLEFVQEHSDKLHSEEGKMVYAKRMSSIEPVFGDLKQNRGFTAFLRRGLENVKKEWRLMAMAFNLLKMHKLCGGAFRRV